MKIFKILFFIIFTQSIMAQEFTADNQKSKIGFVIKNIGLNVNGTFSGLKGIIIFDSEKLNASQMEFSVNANSVNTDNEARDKHLRKEEYFDVDKFEFITFKSTKISVAVRLNRYNVEGNLTIKGITKPIKFELIAVKKDSEIDLKCNFETNRRNFKVGGGSIILSDNVKMNLNIIANKKIL